MKRKNDNLLKQLDDMVKTTLNGRLNVGDQVYESFTALLKPGAPPITARLIKIILLHKVKITKTREGGKITRRGLLAYFWVIIGCFSKRIRRSFKHAEIEEFQRAHTEVCKKKNLPDPPVQRAQLTVETLRVLVRHIGKLNLKPQRKLSVLLFIALSVSTGLRPSSILRSSSINLKKLHSSQSGSRWQEFSIWVLPAKNGTSNDIVAWFKPRWGKTHNCRDTCWFLRSVPELGLSANLLLLALADMEGVLAEGSLQSILDPAFLGPSGRPRKLKYTEAGRVLGAHNFFVLMKQTRCVCVSFFEEAHFSFLRRCEQSFGPSLDKCRIQAESHHILLSTSGCIHGVSERCVRRGCQASMTSPGRRLILLRRLGYGKSNSLPLRSLCADQGLSWERDVSWCHAIRLTSQRVVYHSICR